MVGHDRDDFLERRAVLADQGGIQQGREDQRQSERPQPDRALAQDDAEGHDHDSRYREHREEHRSEQGGEGEVVTGHIAETLAAFAAFVRRDVWRARAIGRR